MKIDYNKTAIIPLDYSKGSKGLWLAVKKNNKYILRLLAIFETSLIEQIKVSNRDLFDYNVFCILKEALRTIPKNVLQMKKTLNQLKASRRNLSLMLLAGMITNLKHIKHFVRDTEVVIRIDTLLTAIERLQSSIKETTYESWSA
mgnify:CR=1 FL=1